MERISFTEFTADRPLESFHANLTIGVFDGVHRGHISILSHCLENRREDTLALVMTFNANPKMLCGTMKRRLPLTTQEQRSRIFEKLGFDKEIVIDFSPEFSKLSADRFLDSVFASVKVDKVIVGEDFRCGEPTTSYGASQLREYLLRKYPATVLVVPPAVLDCKGKVISSSMVRKQLVEGRLDIVRELLGRPYLLDLGSTPFHVSGSCLYYKREELKQLLPRQGLYDARVAGNSEPVSVRIDAHVLEVDTEDTFLLQKNGLELIQPKG